MAEDIPISRIVQQICALQEERVWNQDIFNESHRIFLESKGDKDALSRFQAVVCEVTEELSRISDKLSSKHKMLKQKDAYLADLINKLAEEESTHLQLMASIQVAKQYLASIRRQSSLYQEPPPSPMKSAFRQINVISDLKDKIAASKERIDEIINTIRIYGANSAVNERLITE